MPAWVRVRLPGVGTWSQRSDVPLVEGVTVLDGVDGLGPDGRPLPDQPEQPLEEPRPATGSKPPAATTPGDNKAGTLTPTGMTSPIKE
jgi:hypothetical protein